MNQFFRHDNKFYQFIDHRSNIHSAKAEPRDIQILDKVPPEVERFLREEIAVDIRLNEGCPEIGCRKNLKWKPRAW